MMNSKSGYDTSAGFPLPISRLLGQGGVSLVSSAEAHSQYRRLAHQAQRIGVKEPEEKDRANLFCAVESCGRRQACISCHTEVIENKPHIEGELPHFLGDTAHALGFDQADGEASEPGHVFRAVAGANA